MSCAPRRIWTPDTTSPHLLINAGEGSSGLWPMGKYSATGCCCRRLVVILDTHASETARVAGTPRVYPRPPDTPPPPSADDDLYIQFGTTPPVRGLSYQRKTLLGIKAVRTGIASGVTDPYRFLAQEGVTSVTASWFASPFSHGTLVRNQSLGVNTYLCRLKIKSRNSCALNSQNPQESPTVQLGDAHEEREGLLET